ncbi:hypothetical protein P3T76_007546 [Phytophthora citrophthora]|uniref:Ankyrin repeat-containing domain n=1 Tax=Phytophthora citrophthora TaxID=4793 RepID=A0AAD9GLQ3_9STRA|nr:hypothetical protein P3T76_007546 [Phytophthora citrophthora]
MLKWAHEHRMGRRACTMLRREDELSQLLWNGVAGGSGVAILQNLKDCGLVDKYGPALVEAVAKNDMTSIKWVLANFPQSERISPYCVLVEAASRGNLDVLKYFQSLPAPSSAKIQNVDIFLWSSFVTIKMNVAGRDAYRNVQDNHWPRSSWKSTDAMDDAAANGHLETVQWLHTYRTEMRWILLLRMATWTWSSGFKPIVAKGLQQKRWMELRLMGTCMW